MWGYQYYNGDISGYSAAGELAMAGLGVRGLYKGYNSLKKYGRYTRLQDVTENTAKSPNYSIDITQNQFKNNLVTNGYTTQNGVKYSNGGSGHYNVYNQRTSTGGPGAEYKPDGASRANVKYSLSN